MAAAGADDGEKTLANGGEQARREHPISDRGVICAGQAAQIGAGPNKIVPLGKHDPGAGVVKLEPGFDLLRNLDRQT